MSVYWFDSRLAPNFSVTLNSGECIERDSHLPRLSLYHSEYVFFRERLTGDFKDSDTVWPLGRYLPYEKIAELCVDREFEDVRPDTFELDRFED